MRNYWAAPLAALARTAAHITISALLGRLLAHGWSLESILELLYWISTGERRITIPTACYSSPLRVSSIHVFNFLYLEYNTSPARQSRRREPEALVRALRLRSPRDELRGGSCCPSFQIQISIWKLRGSIATHRQ
ncbi:hypothetical protein BJ166DRAFT_133930 [Pestalotiopsis sp. NC0098]|nr:hypothetical protein BJ166DRAFT_133930 [Pestalotiopsis sp. NC0098]